MVSLIDESQKEVVKPKPSNRRRPPDWWIAKYGAWTKEDFQFIRKIQADEGGEIMANISPKEQMYQSVSYGKVEVIQGLLRFYHDFKAQAAEDFTEELVCIYVDIDKAMKEIKMTDRQGEAIKLYMEGWTEEEIGNKMGGITHQAVHKLVMKVCSKVSDYLGGEDNEK
jgi:predicted DNA-binding protein (UPF0251 family)